MLLFLNSFKISALKKCGMVIGEGSKPSLKFLS
jgi:hypothetical protein